MLDFRCWIAPRFVYATGEDFEGDTIKNGDIGDRIERLIEDLVVHGPKI